MSDLLSVEAALMRIRSAFKVLAPETVALDAAVWRVLAEDLVARRTQPPTAVSAMDGYALKAADIASNCGGNPRNPEAVAGDIALDATIDIATGSLIPAALPLKSAP